MTWYTLPSRIGVRVGIYVTKEFNQLNYDLNTSEEIRKSEKTMQ